MADLNVAVEYEGMNVDRPNAAYRVIQFNALLVGVIGGYVIYLSTYGIESALTHAYSWYGVVLTLSLPVLGLLLGAALLAAGWFGMRRPSMSTVLISGILGWFFLSAALFRAFDYATSWIVHGKVASYKSGAFTVSGIIAAACCAFIFRWLAKRGGVLSPDAHWWNRRNIHGLCQLVTLGMFLMIGEMDYWVRQWIIAPKREQASTIGFFVWLALMALVYEAGPVLLMRLFPPRTLEAERQHPSDRRLHGWGFPVRH